MLPHKLAVGDIFHVGFPNGARPICLTIFVDENLIRARSVTSEQHFEFDRQTGAGIAMWRDERTPCTILSTLPLPVDIHNIILGIDRNTRLEEDEAQHELNEDEKRALLYVANYLRSQGHE
jgi:hypothetical protein